MNFLNNKSLTILILLLLIVTYQNNVYINSNAYTGKQIKVAVLESNPQDPYISSITQGLKNIEQNSKSKIKFTFYDAKLNQAIEYETLDTILKNNVDLILGNLIDTKVDALDNFIDKISEKNIPAVLFNAEPPIISDKMRSYNKFIIVTTNPQEAGSLQGKLIVDEWNKDKLSFDKNGDNVLQYIMLQGALNNVGAIERTASSISTIRNSGIETQELSKTVAFWNEQYAKDAVLSLFLQYADKIEMIIANNDAMAIGAIAALQEYGYNKGDSTKYIPVFGIDGIPAAQDLIKKGSMTGTVFEDPNDTVEALYKIGMNLANNKPPLEDTPYKFSKGETIIQIPYRGTITQ